jgi:CRP-like cAMP-binding protein
MRDFLLSIHDVNSVVLNEYISHWKELSIPKRTIMTAQGETQGHLYFVLEGLQKSYFLNDDKEHIIAFTFAPSFSAIPESFLTQTPSNCYLETITDSRFLKISYKKHQQLISKHRDIETLFRKMTEFFLIEMVERHYQLMSQDIESRFLLLTKKYPHLINMVSNKDLASYLRIDPTNFSKLLNRVKI